MTRPRAGQSPSPLLLGHRGARAVKSIPENTIASFDRCIADGCDGFEFDVRLTGDSEAVVYHDPRVGKIVIARSIAAKLPELPRLHDVLTRYGNAFLDIELKVIGLERIVVEALKDHRPQRFVVSSFLPEALKAVHAANAKIPLGLICETRAQLRRWNQLPLECVIPHYTLVNQDLIREVHAAGKRVLVWTVNLAPMMRRLADWGVDGIISDSPMRLKEVLGAGHPRNPTMEKLR